MIFSSENDFKKPTFFVVYGNVHSYRLKYLDIKIKDTVLQNTLNLIPTAMCKLIPDVFVTFEWTVNNFVAGTLPKSPTNTSSGASCKKNNPRILTIMQSQALLMLLVHIKHKQKD